MLGVEGDTVLTGGLVGCCDGVVDCVVVSVTVVVNIGTVLSIGGGLVGNGGCVTGIETSTWEVVYALTIISGTAGEPQTKGWFRSLGIWSQSEHLKHCRFWLKDTVGIFFRILILMLGSFLN